MAEPNKRVASDVDERLWEAIGRSAPAIPVAVVVLAIGLGVLRGPGAAVLVLAAGALVGAIALLWTSLRVLVGDAPLSLDEAINLGAPTALDEEKRAILRALKDLDYEHSIGKLTEDDYHQLSAKYRAQARAVLQRMDESIEPARRMAEELLASRLAGQPTEADEAAEEDRPAPKARGKKKKAARPARAAGEPGDAQAPADQADEAPSLSCPKCSTGNDLDAAFCKKCGQRLSAVSEG
jgi:hypothetical protein